MSGTKIVMPQTNSFQSGALSFMSCTSGRESSPLDENDCHQTTEFKTESKKKRFHPLRNLRRMFRRKTRRSSISTESYQSPAVDNTEIASSNLEQRSCSTSRLQEENLTQNLIRNSRLNPGLSLSHDSIFTPDRADSGLSSSDLENSSLSITVLTPPSKDCPMKSQSSCSETSLLSIGSSEVELSPIRGGKISELDVGTTAYTLSHSAAKHKMAVKPRRNHGAPRSRRRAMTTKSQLPITPEVSEEGITGKSSPPLEPLALEGPGLSPKCDKQEQDAKISWSDIATDFNAKDVEGGGNVKVGDETETKEEEAATQRSESFFGRFLSRRSDKKKKLLQESNSEESNDEKANFVKKFSKSMDAKGGVTRKAFNSRERVEPVEIPSTFGIHKCDIEKDKEDLMGRKISGSVSPPKSYWPSQMTSRSISPPKIVWSENANSFTKPNGAGISDGEKANASPSSLLAENVLKDWKDPNFMKELTVSINSFAREKSGKREKDDEEEETVLKIRRQHSEDVTPRKLSNTLENVVSCRNASISSESVESMRNCDEEIFPVSELSQPPCTAFKTLHDFPFESVHDGYESVQIIEEVKQEVMNSSEVPTVAAETRADSISSQGPKSEKVIKSEGDFSKTETEKHNFEKGAKLVKKIKPAVSEKPKDLWKTGAPEFLKSNSTRKEPKTPEESESENRKVVPKTKSTLVERRKSELLLLTETEERELKTRAKPLQKRTSFSEVSIERGESESHEKTSFFQEKESSADKTEPTPEVVEEIVVLRKKAMTNTLEEQPELMKVFARRSLKVREGEKIMKEIKRSRDSDKENEVVDSRKEDRKKGAILERDERKENERTPLNSFELSGVLEKEKSPEVKMLKTEMNFRKSVLQRYGRSLSENNGKTKEEAEERRESVFLLEDNKMNKIMNQMAGRREKEEKEKEKEEEEEEEEEERREVEEEMETGFKRIQQRKAEWERRAQQSAK